MAWLLYAMVAVWPRAIIIGFWIFGNTLGGAYDTWVIPALGFLFLPWTTMGYALAWGLSSDIVDGTEWILVACALVADVLTWLLARALR